MLSRGPCQHRPGGGWVQVVLQMRLLTELRGEHAHRLLARERNQASRRYRVTKWNPQKILRITLATPMMME